MSLGQRTGRWTANPGKKTGGRTLDSGRRA